MAAVAAAGVVALSSSSDITPSCCNNHNLFPYPHSSCLALIAPAAYNLPFSSSPVLSAVRSHSSFSPSIVTELKLVSVRQHRYLTQQLHVLGAFSSRRTSIQVARASPSKNRSREAVHRVQSHPPRLDPHKSSLGNEGQYTDGRSIPSNSDEQLANQVDSVVSEPIIVKSQVEEEADEQETELVSSDTALKGTIVAGLLLVGVVGGFGAFGYFYREQINDFLLQFSDMIEGYGPAGYALFVTVYAGLEILAIPAIPLTMSAGLLFGTVTGTIIVSISGTIAATIAFLIARYLARDRLLKMAEGNKKFLAIDKAIGEDGFRVVTLLRLSPLLPFSLGNYLYGLTSVKLIPYILGSWLGMLPGTWAYVTAGALGRAFIQQEAETGGGGSEHLWTIGLGLLVTLFAASYVTRLAKDAVKDLK